MNAFAAQRKGMTLVELLVVVVILVILAASVGPLLGSSTATRGREAASTLAAMATRSNDFARSLKDENKYAGLYLMPLFPRDATAAQQPESMAWEERPPVASADIAIAGGQDDYTGDVSGAKTYCVYQNSSISPRQAIFAFDRSTCRALPARLSSFSVLSVANQSSSIRIIANPGVDLTNAVPSISAQQLTNYWFVLATALKADDTFDTLVGTDGKPFSISMPPSQALPAPLKMPGEYVIDTSWCTFGGFIFRPSSATVSAGQGRFAGLPFYDPYSPLLLLFNSEGKVARFHYTKWDPTTRYPLASSFGMSSAVYLLVGKVDRTGLPYRPSPTDREPGANWQYPDSRWIKIGTGGEVLIADPVPNAIDVFSSQGYARRGISATRL
jgi:prepilin-type N-terminal cleavage/methylation domain-containing protein